MSSNYPNIIDSQTPNLNFSKQYINYTTVLSAENESILTFGVLGRIFNLNELDGEDGGGLFYLLISSLLGLLIMFAVVKLFRSK